MKLDKSLKARVFEPLDMKDAGMYINGRGGATSPPTMLLPS